MHACPVGEAKSAGTRGKGLILGVGPQLPVTLSPSQVSFVSSSPVATAREIEIAKEQSWEVLWYFL